MADRAEIVSVSIKKRTVEEADYVIRTKDNPRWSERNIVRTARVKISERTVMRNALKCYLAKVDMQYDRCKDPEENPKNLARMKVIKRLLKKYPRRG